MGLDSFRPMGAATPPGLSDEKAARMMAALREGHTLRKFGVKPARLDAYFKAHPEYAREAIPLIEVNNKAALRRKGDSLRSTSHCRAGLHPMTAENVFFDGTHGRRRCLACRRASSNHAALISPEVAEQVRSALRAGASLTQVTAGRPAGGGKRNPKLIIASFKKIRRHRREHPDFDQFVIEAIADSASVGLRLWRQRKQNAAKREEINDYHSIRAMLPPNFPGCDDVVSNIFEAMLDGSLRREDVKARIQSYVTAHNRMFPTNFAKFGNARLVSLDEVLFEDGSTTRGDNVSQGLWD
jgi:hypothetical protein